MQPIVSSLFVVSLIAAAADANEQNYQNRLLAAWQEAQHNVTSLIVQ
jgi:hypothetical protein